MTAPAPPIGEAYLALIHSDRVSARTRAVLLDRAQPDDPAYQPRAVSAAQLAALRAVVQRVVPQPGPARIDLAARIDRELASGRGDGWRFDILPPDAEAFRAGLDTLDAAAHAQHGAGFAQLDAARQDALLEAVAAGEAPGGALDPGQMQRWFEDARAEAVRTYVAHPATLAAMGYSGIGYGGDGEPKPGFTHVGPGEAEPWEPAPAGAMP